MQMDLAPRTYNGAESAWVLPSTLACKSNIVPRGWFPGSDLVGVGSLLLLLRTYDERQRQSLLILVLSFFVSVTGFTSRFGADKQDLGDTLPGVDFRRQRG